MTRLPSRGSAVVPSVDHAGAGWAFAAARPVPIAHDRKQAAPAAVVRLATAWSTSDVLAARTYPPTAATAKKTQPSRLTAGCHHPVPIRRGRHPRRADAR